MKFKINALAPAALFTTFLLTQLSGCQRIKVDIPVEATVNGENVLRTELFAAMKLACGPAILQRLVEHKLIIQEAQKQNVVLAPDELKAEFEKVDAQTKDPDARSLLKQELKARALLRKLQLKDVPESTIRSTCETFKEELTQYDLSSFLAPTRDEADKAIKALKVGRRFEAIAERVASLSPVGRRYKTERGETSSVTLGTVAKNLSPETAEAIAEMRENSISEPILLSEGGWVVVKVNKIHNSFQDLRKSTEDVFVEAGRVALVHRLLSESKLSLRADSQPLPSGSPLGTATPNE